MERLANNRPACLLSLTNDLQSILGKNSNIIINLHAGEEYGVASKTYFNSLGLSALLAVQLTGERITNAMEDMRSACIAMEEYLANWQIRIEEIDELLGEIQRTIIIGRGPSMAAALNGALNQKEAAWLFTEGMNAAEFRHGPLELVDSNMTLIFIEGDRLTSKLNIALAEEAAQYGGKAIWIGNNPPANVPSIEIPDVAEMAKPLAEILPLQLMACILANRQNIEAGKFRHIGKVVLKE